MAGERLHRISRRAVLLLSVLALLTVLTGYFQTPQADEGASAHIFQLTIVLLGPALLLLLVTANGSNVRGTFRALAPALVAALLAFGALYYLEHVWHVHAALRNPR